ncbi:tRNA pseudouridine(55) synthase TruB [Bacteriovorax sp. Seq25_V]|uniref:tRNA pseudouridine(55) synthase TruB n=1 Tax=Bacteriovorax sp. Seq25_V TaxID=1201288 RepID=UPI0018DF8F3F|nr:tRNA pseudouridine(55) synthase TruB [Bacteriovorax sp. Seq25_V]
MFFLVNKPVGVSSFDVIRKFKRALSKKIGKIGHFGTLDPFADGLMIVGIGGATRLNDYTQKLPKEYIAKGVLGIKSETGDFTAGEDQYYKDDNYSSLKYSNELIDETLKSFLGEYDQVPHKYSATKFEGKNLYEWAREGVEIKKDPVRRHIYEIELLAVEGDEVTFRVSCSSGTYIRVLFEDLALKLGTFGALKELRRSKIGPHFIENSFELGVLEKEDFDEEFFLSQYAQNIESLVDFPRIDFTDTEHFKFSNGQKFTVDREDAHYWVYFAQELLGLVEVCQGNVTYCISYSGQETLKINNLTTRNSLDDRS